MQVVKNGGEEEGKKEEKQEEEEKQETTISKMEEEQTVAEEEVKWELIQGETEVFYSVWSTIILDLYDIGVPSEQIVGFSNTFDELLVNIQKKDKLMSAVSLANLYGFLPKFINVTKIEDVKKNAIQTKSYIINAYAYIENEEWEKVQNEASNAEKYFTETLSKTATSEDKRKYNINKTYILINELKSSISIKDTEIFYLKYKNLLEELNTLL